VTPPGRRPVVLVHGIWHQGGQLAAMARALEGEGREVAVVDLDPNDGSAPIPDIAAQVRGRADRLRDETGAAAIDLVGFSMGALVSRYVVQRLEGHRITGCFVSISGPHGGTWTAHLSRQPGARQMRPGSPLLQDLDADPDPWRGVRVTSIWSPLDLMIVPARTPRLPDARELRIPVPLHALVPSDRRVVRAVVETLT